MRGLTRSWSTSLAAIALGVAGVTASSVADTRYVDAGAAPDGNGQSWNSAYRFLQDALSEASGIGSGITEIRIAQGVYRPDRSEAIPGGSGNRTVSFKLISGVAVRGGYAGLAGADPNDRDFAAYEAVLSGDLLGNDGPGFAGTDENSLTVVNASGVDASAVLEGVTVTGGNSNIVTSSPTASYLGGGMYIDNGSPQILHCTFRYNRARDAGGMHARFSNIHLESCEFVGNEGGHDAGGLGVFETTAMLSDSTFRENHAVVGGGVRVAGTGIVTVDSCRFIDNTAQVGGGLNAAMSCTMVSNSAFIGNYASNGVGGAFIRACENYVLSGCVFHGNTAGMSVGALAIAAGWPGPIWSVEVRDCIFTENNSGSQGGVIADGGATTFINCLIANNDATSGAVFLFGSNDAPKLVNCTIANNVGTLFTRDPTQVALVATTLRITNSIIWGNAGTYFHSSIPAVEINHSNIQGGWSGSGSNNINAAPLFVQPSELNYRLTSDSPCLNAGDNSAVPSHITTDLDGNARIQNGIVDMGAYEGDHKPQTLSVVIESFGSNQFAFMVPSGAPYNPVEHAAVSIWNASGPDGAYVILKQHAEDQHPGAGGYSTFEVTLELETSLLDGEHRSWVTIPFDGASLNGADPTEVNLAFYNDASDKWELAASDNSQNSPGHNSPVGNRYVTIGGAFSQSFTLGDYGVYWNPDTNRGVAWANVDHAADFRPGVLICIGDLTSPTSGDVGVQDLLILLDAWGAPGGPADLNGDGTVDVDDLLLLLSNWGPCT